MPQCKRYASECKRGCTTKCVCDNVYAPSNGTEGMSFVDEYCSNCIYDNPDDNSPKKCEILTATMLYRPTEPEYPLEWEWNNGHPRCTKFVKWDWGNDGDPDDPDNPKAPPPPPDPNQLDLFPLYPDQRNFEKIVPDVVPAENTDQAPGK